MTTPNAEAWAAALPLPVVVIGPDDRIAVANAQATALLGNGLAGRLFYSVLRQPELVTTIEALRADGVMRQAKLRWSESGREVTYIATAAMADALIVLSFEDKSASEKANELRSGNSLSFFTYSSPVSQNVPFRLSGL